jgi:hypothetical protein
MNRKRCPLLVRSDTTQYMTPEGKAWSTRPYFLECLREGCAAYREQDGFCEMWKRVVRAEEVEEDGAADSEGR